MEKKYLARIFLLITICLTKGSVVFGQVGCPLDTTSSYRIKGVTDKIFSVKKINLDSAEAYAEEKTLFRVFYTDSVDSDIIRIKVFSKNQTIDHVKDEQKYYVRCSKLSPNIKKRAESLFKLTASLRSQTHYEFNEDRVSAFVGPELSLVPGKEWNKVQMSIDLAAGIDPLERKFLVGPGISCNLVFKRWKMGPFYQYDLVSNQSIAGLKFNFQFNKKSNHEKGRIISRNL